MTVNYAGAQDSTPDYHGSYTVSDNHGGSDSAAVGISYQAGHTLTGRSEEHTSELQSLMRISYAVFCLKKKKELTKTACIYEAQNTSPEQYYKKNNITSN